jgi:hypothetical protein
MSTKLGDFPSRVEVGASLRAGFYDLAEVGAPVDLTAGDGRCFAILQVGSLGPGNTVQAFVEESSDKLTWTAVPGANFPTANASNQLYSISFERSRRYVRVAVNQTADSELCALVGQQRKQI